MEDEPNVSAEKSEFTSINIPSHLVEQVRAYVAELSDEEADVQGFSLNTDAGKHKGIATNTSLNPIGTIFNPTPPKGTPPT